MSEIETKYIVEVVDSEYHLIMKNYYLGNEVSKVDCGEITNILNKVKLYNDEYNNLMEQNTIMKNIQDEHEQLKSQLQQKESVIKEVREYIETLKIEDYDGNAYFIQDKYDKCLGIEEIPNKLLEILDKENK